MANSDSASPAAASPTPAKAGVRRIAGDFLVPLAVALVLSGWMAAGDRELDWQRALAGPDGDWPRGQTPFWQFLYRFAPLPATLVAIGAVVALVAGTASARFRPWRRVCWFLILVIVVAPGIIANLILKEHSGRPRPREITEFGGREAYESLFSMDLIGDGKSFPCGHATMGFFFVAGFFLLRRIHVRLGHCALAAGLVSGCLFGYMRMIQGGHFATDVVWAGAITFLTAAGLFHFLGLERKLLDDPKPAGSPSRVPFAAKVTGGLAIAVLIAGLALALPYRAERDFSILHPEGESRPLKPSLKIALGDVEITPGDTLRVTGEAWGHGLPTSEIASRWEEEIDGSGFLRPRLIQRLSGYLTEIRQQLRITIPWTRTAAAKFDLGPGAVRLILPEPEQPKRIELRTEATDLTIILAPGTRIEITADPGASGKIAGTWDSATSGPRYGLVFTKWDGDGKVTIRSESESGNETGDPEKKFR